MIPQLRARLARRPDHTTSMVQPSNIFPHFTTTMVWGGKPLLVRHWICTGEGGRWGFGLTQAEAYSRFKNSCSQFDYD